MHEVYSCCQETCLGFTITRCRPQSSNCVNVTLSLPHAQQPLLDPAPLVEAESMCPSCPITTANATWNLTGDLAGVLRKFCELPSKVLLQTLALRRFRRSGISWRLPCADGKIRVLDSIGNICSNMSSADGTSQASSDAAPLKIRDGGAHVGRGWFFPRRWPRRLVGCCHAAMLGNKRLNSLVCFSPSRLYFAVAMRLVCDYVKKRCLVIVCSHRHC